MHDPGASSASSSPSGSPPPTVATLPPSPSGSPPPTVATLPPSPISPPPDPVTPTTPPRARGATTYPADQSALVPIEVDSAVRGDRDALVTLVVFGDLTCPFTAKTLAQLPALEARYGGDLRIVYKHLPQTGKEAARAAADASAAVLAKSDPEAFFRFADLASKDEHLDAGRLEELGIKVGLPAGTVTDAIAKRSSGKLVDRDVELGRRLGMRGTPVLVYNGRRLDGYQPPEKLFPLLDGELARTRIASRGAPRERVYAARVTANVTTSEGETRP
jgi:protein-disulfide isomerase